MKEGVTSFHTIEIELKRADKVYRVSAQQPFRYKNNQFTDLQQIEDYAMIMDDTDLTRLVLIARVSIQQRINLLLIAIFLLALERKHFGLYISLER